MLLESPHCAVIKKSDVSKYNAQMYVDIKVMLRVWPHLHERLGLYAEVQDVIIPVDPNKTELPTLPMLDFFCEDFQLIFFHPKFSGYHFLSEDQQNVLFG